MIAPQSRREPGAEGRSFAPGIFAQNGYFEVTCFQKPSGVLLLIQSKWLSPRTAYASPPGSQPVARTAGVPAPR